MNPVYKINQQITELSKWKLPPIYPDQIQWGYDHCLGKYAHQSRGKMYCLECGHSWKPTNKRKIQTCPECHNRLETIKDYRTYCKDSAYLAVVTVCKGFQVVRMVWISKTMKMNFRAEYFAKEIMQHWIDENANHTTMTISVNGMSQACDSWLWSSEMKVKYNTSYKASFRHNISPYKTYPKAQILPEFKRNGFKGDFHGISPLEFFPELIRNQHFETLLKAKQYSLMRFSIDNAIHHRLWPSVKICLRNKYIVKDGRIWSDYIDLLTYFNKDVRNAHFICPANLKEEHDRLVIKKEKILTLRRIEDKKRTTEQDQLKFMKEKSKFFDLKLTEGNIDIIVLNSISEFQIEAKEMHHCLYSNGYYRLSDSLILSARKDNKRIETIEVSLSKMKVIQSRGLLNANTGYHDQIINLVNRNINVIQQIASQPQCV